MASYEPISHLPFATKLLRLGIFAVSTTSLKLFWSGSQSKTHIAKSNGQFLSLILLALSATFDTVWSSLLLEISSRLDFWDTRLSGISFFPLLRIISWFLLFSVTTKQWSTPELSPWASFQSIVTPLMGLRRFSYFWYLQAKAFSWIPINMLNCLLSTSNWMFNGYHRLSPDPHHLPTPTPLTPFHIRKWQTLFFQLLRPNTWESTLTSLSFSPNIWLSRQILTTLSSNYIQNPVTFHLLPWNPSCPTIIVPHLNCGKSFLSDLPASAPAAMSLFSTLCPEWSCAHKAGHVTPLLKPCFFSSLVLSTNILCVLLFLSVSYLLHLACNLLERQGFCHLCSGLQNNILDSIGSR